MIHRYGIVKALVMTLIMGSVTMAQEAQSQGFIDILGAAGPIGWLLWILIFATSVVGVALIVDAFMSVKDEKFISDRLIEDIQEAMEEGDVVRAQDICQGEPGPLSNILGAGFENVDSGFEAIQDSLSLAADMETEKVMQKVNYLSVVGNLAPMLGLLGTVQGMIYAFSELGTGKAEPAALANQISTALWTTAFGLLIAIPSMAFFYFFRNKATNIVLKMETISLEQIKLLRHVEVVDEEE